jgi:hypothetical protein
LTEAKRAARYVAQNRKLDNQKSNRIAKEIAMLKQASDRINELTACIERVKVLIEDYECSNCSCRQFIDELEEIIK